MKNGRDLIKQACDEINKASILKSPITCEGIDTATGDELTQIVNNFLDQIESVPKSKEHLLPNFVISVYNGLSEKEISFESEEGIVEEFNVENVEFRRTRFPK